MPCVPRRAALLAVVAALTVVPAARAGAIAADTISGRVTDSAGHPIAGVDVSLAELSRQSTSDADGRFAFAEVAPATYTLVLRHPGYAPVVRRVVVRGATVVEVALRRSIVQLEAVTVTATRSPTEPLTSPLPTSTLGAGPLDRSTGVSLAHALEALSGVHALTTGGEIGKPMIRGLTGARVLVLEQGSRLEDYSWSDEDGPSVEPRFADRVEVIRGPASVLYGSDALGGVVNVIPRDVPDARTTQGVFRGHAELYGASNNAELGSTVRVEGATGALGWLAGLVGRRSEALHTPAGELDNTGFTAVNGEGAVGTQGDWGRLTARFTHYAGEFHLLEADTAQLPPPPVGGAEAGPVRKLADDRVQVGGTFPAGSVRLEARGQWERHRLAETVEGDAASTEPGFDLLLNTLSLDFLVHHRAGSRVIGTVGTSGYYQTNATRGDEPLVPGAHALGGAGFVFERASFGRWSVLAGARVDARRLDADSNIGLGVGAERRSYTAWTGDLGLVFRPAPRFALAANAGRAWRAPTLFELSTNGPHPGEARFEIGRPDLRPEASFNLDVSARWQSDRVQGEIAGFRNRIADYIYIAPTGGTQDSLPVYRYQQTDAVLWGGEASLEVQAGQHLAFRARMDFVHGERESDRQPLPQIPPFRSKLGAQWRTAGFDAGLDVDLVARQTRLSPLDLSTAGYGLLDFYAGVEPHLGARPVRVQLQVRNALDTRYRDFLSRYKAFALNPGRNIVLRLATTF
jgi:iron complex outermembrane receptor protein